jgi:hypothetical protein
MNRHVYIALMSHLFMNKHMLLIGLLFVMLLIPSLSAQIIPGENKLASQIYTKVINNTINVSVVVFEPGQPPTAVDEERKTNKEMIELCQSTYPDPDDADKIQKCIIDQSLIRTKDAKYDVKFHSVKGANVSFLYWNPYLDSGPGWTQVPDCGEKQTNSRDVMYIWNATTEKEQAIDYWTFTCPVPTQLYKGQKMQVRVVYLPGPNENIMVSEARIELNDANTSIGDFTSIFYKAIEGLSGESDVSVGDSSLPCLGVFLILGLLLASMYFAGRSPITLLDITTPRLPSPKGFTAGGQILAPFGYTEMKRTTLRKMAAAGAVAHTVINAAKKGGRGTLTTSAFSKITAMKRMIKDPEQAAIFEAMAISHLKHGGKLSDLRKIAKPFNLMTEKDLATFRTILNNLERAGGRDALFSKTAADWVQSKDLMKTLDTLTYKGGKVTGRVQKVVGKLYGVNRYTILGPIITGSLDSMLRSTSKLKNLAKASVVHGGQVVRESGKWAVETAGGKAAMKRLEADRPGLYKFLTKEGRPIKIGELMPIKGKMSELHARLHDEMHKDQVRYLLKQLYRKMGLNTAALTDEVLHEMATKNVDLVKLIGYKGSARMAAVELEIAAILSNGSLSIIEKKDRMEALLQSLGGHLDTNYIKMKERLDAISREEAEGHVKLVTLMAEIDRENQALAAAKSGESRNDDKYYSLVGRNSLHGSDLMEVALMRRMIYDHENGHTSKDVNMKDFVNALRLDVEDRYRTLDSTSGLRYLPEFMRDKGVAAAKTETNRKMLAGLLTDEGEHVLKTLTGKTKSTASIDDFMKVLYGNDYLLHSQGIKKDKTGLGVHTDPKTGKTLFWEDDEAVGPKAGLWKVDMKRWWRGGIDTRDLGQIGAWVEGKWTRGYTRPHNPAIEAEMDRYQGSRTWSPAKREMETKKLWVKEHMEKEMHNSFNSRYTMNAYGGTTSSTMKYYANVAASMLAKALRDSGDFQERHTDLQFLEKELDVNNPKHMERFTYMLKDRYKQHFDEVIKRGVTFDDIAKSKHAWIMTHEGTYVPHRAGAPVSDFDRILGGKPALRDNKGVMRSYSPDDVAIDFKDRKDLGQEFNRIANSNKKEDWQPFLKSMSAWNTENGYDYERAKIAGAVLWRYGNNTYDYQSYWKQSGVQIAPRHEATPLAPSVFRFFGSDAPKLTKTLKPLRDFSQIMGNYMVRTAYDGTGDKYMSSYDISPKSNIVKIHSWRLASQVMTTDWKDMLKDVTSEHDRRKMASAYRAVALAHGSWAQVQAFTVDRHPGRASTSHGAHQGWSAAFGMGPAQPIPLRANLRAYMDKYEYGNFMVQHGWAALLARKLIMPYQKMISGAQRSMQGYAGKWDTTNDPLRPFGNYTSPRLLEAMRFMNPMSYSWGRGWASKKVEDLSKFQSRAEKAQLTGYDHQLGLRQSYSDIHMVHKGAAAVARTGLANPGASYMDTRFTEQLAPAMAEYAMMKTNEMTGYYRNDPYVRRQALTDTIHRTVSAEALAIRRQQEMMGYGISQNTLYTWFNPLLFAYHGGVPGMPNSLTLKQLSTTFVNRWRRGYSGGNIKESVGNAMGNAGKTMSMAFKPWMAGMVKYCSCGGSGYSPGVCKNCAKRI